MFFSRELTKGNPLVENMYIIYTLRHTQMCAYPLHSHNPKRTNSIFSLDNANILNMTFPSQEAVTLPMLLCFVVTTTLLEILTLQHVILRKSTFDHAKITNWVLKPDLNIRKHVCIYSSPAPSPPCTHTHFHSFSPIHYYSVPCYK